jgi:hypothetical protein
MKLTSIASKFSPNHCTFKGIILSDTEIVEVFQEAP